MLDRVVLVTVAAAAAAASVAAAVFDDDFGSYWPSSAQAQPNGFRDADDAGFSLQYAQTLFGDKPATGREQRVRAPRVKRCLRSKGTWLINSDSARCFSCMSRFYEAVWPALSHVYKRPRNFTDYCNDDVVDPRHVPVVDCPTICIRMWEEPTVAGVRIRGHIRGCLDDLLHNGFNQTIVTWYRWMHRDSCRQYRKRELFMLNADESDDSYVNVCTCYADHCNSAGSASRATVTLATAATTFLLVLAVRWL
uniref:Homolog of Odr-2 (Two) n=1 Tax=Steinernema glaseri TaxID=37863 RepID=A0A1I8AUF2_9BILA